ncbi:hypothetical protein QYE76_030317 [Lolium multiflorum]|uniref:Mitochondrial import inner membrane translocase subunit n=1 Tax=Lolium multiflorum TaxID=4521 RepID=A0AAD8QSV6_LOLMU|nr:hypothetical protein QYE76_030317 [Lolium multiflorum]
MDSSPELQRFLEQEKQNMMMKELVGKLTSICWDKCITSAPGSKFSSGESTCLTNCTQRYLDMTMIIAKRLQM